VRLATAAAGGLASTLAGQLTGILTARMLGPEAKGTLVLAFLVPTLAVAALSLSQGPANVFFIARGRHEERTVLWTSLSPAMPLGLACTLALQSSSAPTGRCASFCSALPRCPS
jgi:O-antigen/teichoic acid export membrane protein